MARIVLTLALAALAATSAAAQKIPFSGEGLRLAAAATATKGKGGNGGSGKCNIGTPEVVTLRSGDGGGDGCLGPGCATVGRVDHPFVAANVSSYIANQLKPPLLSNTRTTFDCVDSREPSVGYNPHLGTAGGDFAELSTAIFVYFQQMNQQPTAEAIEKIFRAFMNTVVTPSRPFYLHQSEDKLNKVLNDVLESGLAPGGVRPASLPLVGPPEGPLREVYIESLIEGAHQGCGHVRLMIDEFPKYGLDSPFVPQELLKAFYNYWWFTPVGSAERKKIEFPILQGLLEGDGIAVVSAAAKTGACSKVSPSIVHAWRAGQIFVANLDAAKDFRELVLTPFFAGIAKAEGKTLPATYFPALQKLQGEQLGYTITNLGTAKDCPVFAVNY